MRWLTRLREHCADGTRLTDRVSDVEAQSVADGLTRLLAETLASPPDTFAVVASIVNPDVFVLWTEREGGLDLEIADPGRHRRSPLEELAFVRRGNKFKRHFTEDEDMPRQIGEILASVLNDAFGISDAHDLRVDGPKDAGRPHDGRIVDFHV